MSNATVAEPWNGKEYQRRKRFERVRPLAERQNWLCPSCNKRLPGDLLGTDKDHIIPRARGGPADAEWNWQLLHSGCNRRKREHLAGQSMALAAEYGVVIGPPIVRRGRGPDIPRIDPRFA